MPTQSIPAAADRLGLSQATVRRRIKRGEIPATLVDGAYQVPTQWLDEHTQDATQDHAAAYAVLEQRLHGALTACRLHAKRASEAEQRLQWLTAQVEERTRAESELRVLLLRAEDTAAAALRQVDELRALPPAPARPWWRWWRT